MARFTINMKLVLATIICLYLINHGLLMPVNHGAHFTSLRPYQDIGYEGEIGPWKLTYSYGYSFYLIQDYRIEITRPGLYQVYAQVLFLLDNRQASFSIQLIRDGEHTSIVQCATSANLESGPTVEATCYTQSIIFLNEGDSIIVNIDQVDRNVDTTEASSFFGVEAIYFLSK